MKFPPHLRGRIKVGGYGNLIWLNLARIFLRISSLTSTTGGNLPFSFMS